MNGKTEANLTPRTGVTPFLEHMAKAGADDSDISKMWRLMDDSNAATLALKFYKDGTSRAPFRAIVFVQGHAEVEDVLTAVEEVTEKWNG